MRAIARDECRPGRRDHRQPGGLSDVPLVQCPLMPTRLTRATMHEAAKRLAAQDAELRRAHRTYGPPPLWARPAAFATLVLIIFEQQVSLASGRSAYQRLERLAGAVDPETVARLGSQRLRSAGLTRQKSRYVVELATAILDTRLDLNAVARMSDDDARDALTTVPGIGRWTANIYLLMGLRRPDVWPVYDLALRKSFGQLSGLDQPPTDDELADVALRWRPYRSVAARMLWHYYLETKKTV